VQTQWTRVATRSEFGETRKLVRTIQGHDILLVRMGDEIVAVENRCTHLGQPLERGRVMAGQITCPFHGACFDLRSGAAISGPAVAALRRYPVQLDGDVVLLDLR
jgi:nitrite reductase/ring-hydroxylating ferredoxin subunit